MRVGSYIYRNWKLHITTLTDVNNMEPKSSHDKKYPPTVYFHPLFLMGYSKCTPHFRKIMQRIYNYKNKSNQIRIQLWQYIINNYNNNNKKSYSKRIIHMEPNTSYVTRIFIASWFGFSNNKRLKMYLWLNMLDRVHIFK